ncbi:hypothetical protein BCR36DRAFT_417150 [Piromyces finnis]|uniref:Methyltransferase type 11 domain-containing protein n=1 Tax=Piromyces finnis TaxID=1754191 RepID=A0A1Y1UDP5_9FUNG|nr:hypothetical protein BCR36DRAFT_417150 [Piromyces finnis]|eukprot:ORX36178.1 hypothetical protein BCR36DRAFT_417150 [Piromyces finnis]
MENKKINDENKIGKSQEISEEEKKEEHFVHDVYEAIAPHFSDTRYKDFAISIAVIHHFTTPERRREAIEEILRVLKKGCKVLIFVWAFEQDRKKYDEQDVLIPWHIPKKKYLNKKSLNKKDYTESEKSEHLVKYERYYHLFKKGELDDLVDQIKIGKVVETGYDRDNWYVIAERI